MPREQVAASTRPKQLRRMDADCDLNKGDSAKSNEQSVTSLHVAPKGSMVKKRITSGQPIHALLEAVVNLENEHTVFEPRLLHFAMFKQIHETTDANAI